MKTGTKHTLAAFSREIEQIGKDPLLHGSHISLYIALFVCYRQSGYQNPFPITRKTVMGFSKVASIATYHKCMRQLNDYGYIRYKPSYDPVKGSLVYWSTAQEGEKNWIESARSENFQSEPAGS